MFGFDTILIAEKGRETLYTEHYPFLYEQIKVLDKFQDMLNEDFQNWLIEERGIFIPNRSFSSYIPIDDIEERWRIPTFGSISLLRTEDRGFEKGQYYLLKKAGILTPRQIKSWEEIDCLVVVKVQHAKKPLERAFFYVSSPKEFLKESKKLLKMGIITAEGLAKARIEEFALGPVFNTNSHVHALKNIFGNFSFVGFAGRIQSNKGGFLELPAREQLKINVPNTNQEVGHEGRTMRESLKIHALEAVKKFIKICQQIYPPGMIGMCGLQGILVEIDGKIYYVLFDVSPRVPGDPIIGPTSPEMRILNIKLAKLGFNAKIEDPLDMTMLEIEEAHKRGRLPEIVT